MPKVGPQERVHAGDGIAHSSVEFYRMTETPPWAQAWLVPVLRRLDWNRSSRSVRRARISRCGELAASPVTAAVELMACKALLRTQ